jgi:hypothetical protein
MTLGLRSGEDDKIKKSFGVKRWKGSHRVGKWCALREEGTSAIMWR